MSGIIHLYVYDNKVFKIPSPKDRTHKAILELANKDVLYTYLVYTTKNRKPDTLTDVFFDKISLDNEGQYRLTKKEIDRKSFNFIHFGFQTIKSLSESEELWIIPQAPVIPNSQEISIILKYLFGNYPSLATNALWVIDSYIADVTQHHKKTIDMIKKAKKLKIHNKE